MHRTLSCVAALVGAAAAHAQPATGSSGARDSATRAARLDSIRITARRTEVPHVAPMQRLTLPVDREHHGAEGRADRQRSSTPRTP